jgi:phosphoribosyl 1,2-cyclic phosphate phosphodiesterase
MEFLLLGTAAAEAWPSPFCDCAVCATARQRGGRNIRARSAALLDGTVQIDFGPDVFAQLRLLGRDLTKATSLVFTHHHDDHLAPAELMYRGPWFTSTTQLPTMHVFGNATVVDILRSTIDASAFSDDDLHIAFGETLRPFITVATPDGTEILPLPADHAPKSLVLRLTRKGKRIFYGHDSGSYPPETVAALSGTPLDLALFDCTNGIAPSHNRGHMSVDGVLQSIERLRHVGAVTEQTTLVATHFSHNGKGLYEDLCAAFEPHGVVVAYDGLAFEL